MRYAFVLSVAALTVGFDGTVAAGQKAGNITIHVQQDTGTVDLFANEVAGRRARIGVNVSFDPRPTDSLGALIEAVTPGGPAARAGIRSGDIIVKLDGRSVIGAVGNKKLPGMSLISLIARLEPNEPVPVEFRRGDVRKKVSVVPESVTNTVWIMNNLLQSSPLAALETVPLNPDLGQYFDVTEGMLVISVPDDRRLGLKGGDVILSVDGQKPSDAGHLIQLMRRDTTGQPIKLKVMRHRKLMTVAVRWGAQERMTGR